MKILGIETSCDDTAISLIELDKETPDFRVIYNRVSSQTEIHQEWGGIHPNLARREHQKNLPFLLEEILVERKLPEKDEEKEERVREILKREDVMMPAVMSLLKKYEKPDIDLIALTVGPGLDPSLWTGVNFAKALSCWWEIPIVPVNHIEAHLIISMFSLEKEMLKFKTKESDFPALGLVVSGGHTQLILMKELGKYKVVGETRDDAAGECFDKAARIMGLGYPGGPAIASEAEKASYLADPLPRPMIGQKNHDFSFSGLKTSVLYRHKANPERINDPEYVRAESKEIQRAIIDVLVSKTLSAAEKYRVKSIITGGGVISNKELRRHLSEKSKMKIFFPPAEGRTDNALMISVAGYFGRKKACNYDKIKADSNLRL